MDGRGANLPESSEQARQLVGEQDTDSRRADGGGTAEEMDRNEVDEGILAERERRDGRRREIHPDKMTTGWALEGDPPRHRERRLGQRLVAVAAAVGREGSKRLVVAAAGVMVVLRRRCIGMELMMGAEGPAGLQAPSDELTRKSG